MHSQINLTDDFKSSIEHQRRLNPPMHEFVKKETIKWLDVGVIFQFLDIQWVRPMYFFPKRGGITVFQMKKLRLLLLELLLGDMCA